MEFPAMLLEKKRLERTELLDQLNRLPKRF
jgi:hypothetical protein